MMNLKNAIMTATVVIGFSLLGTACGEKKDTGKDVAIQFLQRDVAAEKARADKAEATQRCLKDKATDSARLACY